MKKEILELKISVFIISLLCLFFMVIIKDLKMEIKEIKDENNKIYNYFELKEGEWYENN